MAGLSESLLAKLGLDISEFKAKAAQAGNDVKSIKKDFGDLKETLAMGGIAQAAIKVFSAIIEHAKQSKDATDENVAAVQRYGESLSDIKTSALDFGVTVVGSINRFGESAGTFLKGMYSNIVGTRAEFESTEKALEASEKSLREVEANLANAKKHAAEFNAINKQIADLDKKREDATFKALTDQERINQLTNEEADLATKLANFTGTALEKRKLILELKQTEAQLEEETSKYAEKQKKEAEERFEMERKEAMSKLDNAEKYKVLAEDIAEIEAAIASGDLNAKDVDEARLLLKSREKELSELTGKMNEEERKQADDFQKKARLSKEEELELFKLAGKSAGELTAAEKLRLDVLQAQRLVKINQAEMDVLLEKGIENLTIEEEARLDELIKQAKELEKQLKLKKDLTTATSTQQIPAEKGVLELQLLIAKGVDNLTAAEKRRVKELELIEAKRKVDEEITGLLDKGVGNLTNTENDRLQVLQQQGAELSRQLGLVNSITVAISRKGNAGNTQLTDRQLAEKIANLEKGQMDELFADPTGKYSYLSYGNRLDLANAKAEQATRAAFRRDVARLGAEEALGNRSAFEEDRYRNYIRPEDEARSVRQAAAIDRLDQRLARIFPLT